MGFLREYREARREDHALGRGVWRRAHDRFRRGLDRYHQVLESITDPALREPCVAVANELADLLPAVHEACEIAQRRGPSQTQDVPSSPGGYLSDVHRELSRAGNAMAQTAEALTMARFSAAGAHGTPGAAVHKDHDTRCEHETGEDPRAAAVRRRAHAVAEHVARARDLLAQAAS